MSIARNESKFSRAEEKQRDEYDSKDSKQDSKMTESLRVDVTSIDVAPKGCVDISAPLNLQIVFELEREVERAHWEVQLLVDTGHNRIIKKLGKTTEDYYPDGESTMRFDVDHIDISGIPPSALTNSGLLMALFIVEGEEVISVNMVVNVTKKNDRIVREILNPFG